ncbi:hypothetical protein D3C76_1277050 [compost metagenome]
METSHFGTSFVCESPRYIASAEPIFLGFMGFYFWVPGLGMFLQWFTRLMDFFRHRSYLAGVYLGD